MPKKKAKGSWGGRRPGAGRPSGKGSGPSPDARIHRIPEMVREADLEAHYRMAEEDDEPLATVAYDILEEGLKRRRKRKKKR